jgi:hypothetical protein
MIDLRSAKVVIYPRESKSFYKENFEGQANAPNERLS